MSRIAIFSFLAAALALTSAPATLAQHTDPADALQDERGGRSFQHHGLVGGVASGDAIAGEAQAGTLRYLLAVPVPRSRLLAAKALATLLLVAALLVTYLFPEWQAPLHLDERSSHRDRTGTNNLYLYGVEGETLHRITDVLSGVIAVTTTLPALAVARKAGSVTGPYLRKVLG